MNIWNLTIEIIIGLFFLFIIVAIVGKKIINQVTPFTFIASIVLSELLGNAVYDEAVGVFGIIYTMTLWGVLIFILEYMGRKFLFFRGIFEGKPAALIKNGVIDREALKKNRMNLNQLQSLLRQSETFSIREVAYCYLEPNGSISILKKPQYQKTTLGDLNIIGAPANSPVTVIRDGELLKDELEDLGYDEFWLNNQLNTQNVAYAKDVFVAEWLEGEGMFIQTYQ